MASTILVADDDVQLRDTIAWCLRVEGYRVLTAADGHEALLVMRARPQQMAVDLAVLDVRMPLAGGPDVISAMRADPELRRIPVVVLTGFPDEAPGDVTVLQKPFAGTRLLEIIQAILGRRRTPTPPGLRGSGDARG